MKDKEVKERLDSLERCFRTLNDIVYEYNNKLRSFSLKDCPKCKHPVLAKFNDFVTGFDVCTGRYCQPPSFYQCLTCGTRFKCESKDVCEIIE